MVNIFLYHLYTAKSQILHQAIHTLIHISIEIKSQLHCQTQNTNECHFAESRFE